MEWTEGDEVIDGCGLLSQYSVNKQLLYSAYLFDASLCCCN